MVGLVFGVVLEIFEILLPRITSGLKIFFTFHFFPFFLQLGWYWVGFSKFFYLGWDGILFFSLLWVLSMEGMGVAGSSNFAFDSFKTFLLFLFIMLLFQVDSFSILFKRTMRGEPLAIFFRKARFWHYESNGGSPEV